jgi:hypothetical protein
MSFVRRHLFQRAGALGLALAVSTSCWSTAAEPQLPDTPPIQAPSGEPSIDQDRAKVREFIERSNVKEKLQALGVSGFWAQSRVDSLSQEEVHALAQRIDGMPAGGTLSQMDLVIVLLIAILVAILL